MRVTTDIWVHVFVRREANRGAFVTVQKKGAVEAGAIYVIENRLDGAFFLYGPAPQSLIDDESDDRLFETIRSYASEDDIDIYLAKQKNFDPDIWIIETECRQGPPSMNLANKSNSEKF